MSEPRTARAQDADGRLTSLLARWADVHRLTEPQAAAIREQIVGEPALLDFDWWWRLLDPESGTAFRGLQRSSRRREAAPTFVPPEVQRPVWAPSRPSLIGWTQDTDDFQPYLRLT